MTIEQDMYAMMTHVQHTIEALTNLAQDEKVYIPSKDVWINPEDVQSVMRWMSLDEEIEICCRVGGWNHAYVYKNTQHGWRYERHWDEQYEEECQFWRDVRAAKQAEEEAKEDEYIALEERLRARAAVNAALRR
jgi:hypothetical protein